MLIIKFFTKCFLVLTIIILVNFHVVGQNLNINPTILKFRLSEPESIATQAINITNNSDNIQAIEAYLGDWDRNIDGSHSYFDPNSQDYSCASWIILNTNLLEIGPHESVQLMVSFNSPSDMEQLEKMKWAMIYIQGTEIKEEKEESDDGQVHTMINEIIRMGIHVYQTPAQLKLFEAKAISLVKNEEDANIFDFHIENSGEVMIDTRTFLELTNINTGEEFKGEMTESPIFPEGKRIVSLQLPKDLPKGEYSMLGILDYGNPNSLEAIERIIEIK